MAGSSRDHERGAHLPDELSDILRSLSAKQTNILYHALTNHPVRGYFLDLLQNRVTEIAENHTRAADEREPGHTTVLRKAMPKQRPPLSTSATEITPYRPSTVECYVAPQRCELHRSASTIATTIITTS